jgi:hypothetical protein
MMRRASIDQPRRLNKVAVCAVGVAEPPPKGEFDAAADFAREIGRIEEGVSRPFPSWNRSTLTEIDLCHAWSDHGIEYGNGRAGRSQGPGGLGRFQRRVCRGYGGYGAGGKRGLVHARRASQEGQEEAEAWRDLLRCVRPWVAVAALARLRAPRLGGCAWSMANGCGGR